MNEPTRQTILILGATGKTGSRVAQRLSRHPVSVRTAARSKADVRFDWGDRLTFAPALTGVTGVYLVAPVMRIDFAPVVSRFLDEAERAGVRHVTLLSANRVELAPPDAAPRAVELDLIARRGLTHSIVRPAWFMQNFSETFLKPLGDAIVVPTGSGTEAFVDAEDVASVAVATLVNPDVHAGKAYAPTGPEALRVADAAAEIARATGRPIVHRDLDRTAWVEAMIGAGVPASYGEVLRGLTATIAEGHGAQPNGDVERVTGVPPTSFASFAARTAKAWR